MHLLPLRPEQEYVCCIGVGDLSPVPECCLVGGSVFERSQESRLVETAGLPMGSPTSSASSRLSPIQALGSLDSVH